MRENLSFLPALFSDLRKSIYGTQVSLTCNPSASASWVLGTYTCASMLVLPFIFLHLIYFPCPAWLHKPAVPVTREAEEEYHFIPGFKGQPEHLTRPFQPANQWKKAEWLVLLNMMSSSTFLIKNNRLFFFCGQIILCSMNCLFKCHFSA